MTIDHSAFRTTASSGSGSITAADTDGNLAVDPGLHDPSSGDFTLGAGSPLIGAGDGSLVTNGETDASGQARSSTCPGGLRLVDVGAYESPTPACPPAGPSPQPGPTTYAYVSRGFNATDAYGQLVAGSGGQLSQLSPFELSAVASGGFGNGPWISGSAARQVYSFEASDLQQYDILANGQLSAAATIAPRPAIRCSPLPSATMAPTSTSPSARGADPVRSSPSSTTPWPPTAR